MIGLLSVVFVIAALFSYPLLSASAGEDDDKDYSFYKLSSAASAYFDDIRNGESSNYVPLSSTATTSAIRENTYSNWANAGGLVGFIDTNYDTGLIGSMVSVLAASTQSRSYLSFWQLAENGGGYGLSLYANYGRALNELGLDSTAYKSFTIDKLIRFLLGGIMFLVYYACFVAERLMVGMVKVIQVLNPFQWFLPSPGNEDNFFEGELRTAISDSGNMQNTLTSGISEYYYTIMSAFQSVGYVFLLFSMVALIVSMILLGRTNMRSKVLKFITRFVFFLIGVPMLGLMFTSMFMCLVDDVDQNGLGSNKVVMSTFVDFGSWAKNAKLALPGGTQIVMRDLENGIGTVDVAASTGARTLATKINELGEKPLGAGGITNGIEKRKTNGGYDNNSLVYDESKGFIASDLDDETDSVRSEVRKKSSSFSNKKANDVMRANSIIVRYMLNDFYHATDFETEYKSRNSLDKESAKKLFESIKADGDYEDYIGKDKLLKGSPNGGDYLHDGEMTGIYDKGKTKNKITYKSGNGDTGLSTLSMYNYLNTTFDDSSITSYSEHKSTSVLTRHAHYSISLIGGGSIMGMLYYLSSITMLLCLAVLAFFYAFGMLFGAISKMMKIVTTVPWAMLGGMKAIIKVVTLTIMAIIEIVGTIIAYRVVTFSFISLGSIYEKPMQALFTSAKVLDVSIYGALIAYAVLIISIIMNLYFMIVSLRVRKQMVSALNDWVGEFLDKFFSFGEGTHSAPASSMMMPSGGGSALGTLGKAVAGGAMLAGGHALMNKMSGGNGSPGDMSPVSSGSGAEMASGVAEDVTGTNGDGFDKLEAKDAPLGLPDKSADASNGGGSPDGSPDGSPVSPNPLNPDDGDGGAAKSLEEQFDNPNVTSLGDIGSSQNDANRELEPVGAHDNANKSSADTKDAVKHGAMAGAHGAAAYVKGASGDVKGAAKSGKEAVSEAGKAKNSLDKGDSADKSSNNAQTSLSHSTSNVGGSVNNSTSKNVSGGHNSKSSTASSSSNNSSNKTSVANAGSKAVNNSNSDTRVASANVKSDAKTNVNSKSDSFENNAKVVNGTDKSDSHEAKRVASDANTRSNADAKFNKNAGRMPNANDAMVNDAIRSGEYHNDGRVKSSGAIVTKQAAASFTNKERYLSMSVAFDKKEIKKALSSNKFKAAAVGGVAAGVMISSSKRKKLEEKKKEKKSDYI